MTPTPAQKNETVRAEVLALLERSQAFRALPESDRRKLAEDMSTVSGFLADKDWLSAPAAPSATALAKQPSAQDVLKMRMAQKQGFVGAEFRAGGVREGVEAFGELVKKVDFPKFVSGLVQGVFHAVVEASIEQMRAYGELLAATAKTVDQFASENISDAQARDHIANRFPGAVVVDTEGEKARLRAGEDTGVDLGAELGVEGVDLDDDESEQRLVNAAKLELARSRQQLLATMVLMGINRIVVTNGHINAKVVFDMRASDAARRRSKAEYSEREKSSMGTAVGGFSAWIAGGITASHEHETTVGSAVDETSEAKAEVKAQLSGDVRLAFKSETFPLERMVDVMGLEALQQKATPAPTRRSAPRAAQAGAAAPAAPGAPPPGGTTR